MFRLKSQGNISGCRWKINYALGRVKIPLKLYANAILFFLFFIYFILTWLIMTINISVIIIIIYVIYIIINIEKNLYYILF